MKRYLITNPRYSGEAMILYNEAGLLQKIDIGQTDMDAVTIASFKKAVPVSSNDLETAFGKQTVIVESEITISFEQFWKKYDYKFHKDRAELLYTRLSKTNQILAYYAIDKYNKYLRKKDSQSKLHPDTYIRNKAWLNEY